MSNDKSSNTGIIIAIIISAFIINAAITSGFQKIKCYLSEISHEVGYVKDAIREIKK